MKKSVAVVLFTFHVALASSHSYCETHQSQKDLKTFDPLRIAHAGGGLNNETYTNSYEALESNLKKGFLYFELDFSFTSDKKLICLHDWEDDFRRSFGFSAHEKVSLEEFQQLAIKKSKYEKCTIYGLANWMEKNPAAFVITDVKDDNIGALKIIRATLPNAERRVIPQIYNPDSYYNVKEMGFEKIIWTLYRYDGTNKEVVERAKTFQGPIAITMPTNRAATELPGVLKRLDIPTYVHTINSAEDLERYFANGITEIYTDFLSP
ncbi:MAG: hypothetical protein CMK32_02140 [Porticoccaceae bacterium]|nr:hypothetical protein [Porticoccaceae bacterium]